MLTQNQFLFSVTWEILDVEMEVGHRSWSLTAARYITSVCQGFQNSIHDIQLFRQPLLSYLKSGQFHSIEIGFGKNFLLFLLWTHFIMAQSTGVTKLNTTLLEERLGLTHKRPSYRPTGTHPSPRSVLEWRSIIRLTSTSSTSRPTPSTRWSLTGNTAPPQWAVTRGWSWLVHRHPYSETVTRKASMLSVLLSFQKQESASLEIMKKTALLVIPELGLEQEQEENIMTPTRVETRQEVVERKTLKPRVISWYIDKQNIKVSRNGPNSLWTYNTIIILYHRQSFHRI